VSVFLGIPAETWSTIAGDPRTTAVLPSLLRQDNAIRRRDASVILWQIMTSSSATLISRPHRYSRGLPRPEVRGLRHSRGQRWKDAGDIRWVSLNFIFSSYHLTPRRTVC